MKVSNNETVLLLSIIGMEWDGDADFEGHADDLSFDGEFTLISVRGLVAFFVFFGWSGVILIFYDMSTVMTVIVSVLAGFSAMLIVAYVFYTFHKLEDKGNIEIDNAIGAIGEVYIRIPGKGARNGKVFVPIQGRIVELLAKTKGPEIPTGSKIRVQSVLKGNVLLVEQLIE